MSPISCIENLGGTHSQICIDVTKLIWSWCKDKGIWLSGAHIPGHKYYIADYNQCIFRITKSAWSLNLSAFLSLTRQFVIQRLIFLTEDLIMWYQSSYPTGQNQGFGQLMPSP